MAFHHKSNIFNRLNDNNNYMSSKIGKRTVNVSFKYDAEESIETILIKENKKISDLIEKIYRLDKLKQRTIKIIHCDNINKNILFLKKNDISIVYPDAHQNIKLHIYFCDNHTPISKKSNSEVDIFNLHKKFDINKRELHTFPLEKFIFYINKKTNTDEGNSQTKIHPYLLTYFHYYPKSVIISAEDINISIKKDDIIKNLKCLKINIKEKEKLENHFEIIREIITNKNNRLSTVYLNYDYFIWNSLKEYNDSKTSFIKSLNIRSPLKNMSINELNVTISPYSFDLISDLYKNDFKMSCEILNCKLIISFSNKLELDPEFSDKPFSTNICINDYFDFIKCFRANFINLKLIGAYFNNRELIDNKVRVVTENDFVTENTKKPKEIILSLKINDLRNEFNNVENIQHFYDYLCETCDTNYLEKFILKNTVIPSPLALIKLGEIIKDLKLKVIKFVNIGITFEINESTYEALKYFYDCILNKKLTSLVFRYFPILDLNFMQKFSNYTCKNYLVTYEFSFSMINREIEVLKFNENNGYCSLQVSSYLNYCLNVEKLNLRSLFSNVQSLELRNFKLGSLLFKDMKSKFFKKLFYKSDFNNNIRKFFINNCNSREYNTFAEKELQKKFSLDLNFPHDKQILIDMFNENITYTPFLFLDKNTNNFIIDSNSENVLKDYENEINSLNKYEDYEDFTDIFNNLNELNISNNNDSEYRYSKYIRKCYFKDCKFKVFTKILIETNFEKLTIQFSKPLTFFNFNKNHYFNPSYVSDLTLIKYAVHLNFNVFKEDKAKTNKIDKLTLKYITTNVLDKRSIFTIIGSSFSMIKGLKIVKSDFKESFTGNPDKRIDNLSRVDLDFNTLFNFIENKTNNCEDFIRNLIEYFGKLSKKLHPGNIYVDERPILSGNYLEELSDKIKKKFDEMMKSSK